MKTMKQIEIRVRRSAAMLAVAGGLLLACGPERAAAAPAQAADAKARAGLPEMAAVEQFLQLSDAELDQLSQVIARIRAMTPEQRATLTREVGAYRSLPEKQRLQMRQGWGRMPQEIQDAWREMMLGASDARRAEVQAKLATLSPDEKVAYRRQLVDEYLKAKAKK